MQPERRFYNSITAEALCESGHFVLYGHTLSVFSLTHSALLTQLQCPAWVAASYNALDLLHAALICSGALTLPSPEQAAKTIAAHDFAAQCEIWSAYCEACTSSPIARTSPDHLGSKLSAPDEMVTAAFLHQHSNLTEREIWHGCYGKNNWLLASISEQLTGKSAIVTDEDLAEIQRAESEEGQRKSEDDKALFAAIEARYTEDLLACKSPEERDYARRAYLARLRDFQKLDPLTLEVRKC
ncbi:MAG: hypothetical protein EBR82_19115 [Caulobacteraceae bacterium]|nr:hypothetical protein [Caulobacteraceae bacterium]